MLITQSNIDAMIQGIQQNYPEILRPIDIIKTGLYKSRSDLCWSMKRGMAPPSIKLSSHKVIFPRAAIFEWLREKAGFVGGQGNDSSQS